MNLKTDSKKIRIEMTLSVSPEKAWELLTENIHIANWWGDHVQLEPKPGGNFREVWFDNERRVVTSGNITTFNPPSELKMTWADDDWPEDTIVTFSLTEGGGGTQLIFEHSGWEIHPYDERQNLMDNHAAGWSLYLKHLAQYATEIY